jgi:hypothetical protein
MDALRKFLDGSSSANTTDAVSAVVKDSKHSFMAAFSRAPVGSNAAAIMSRG